MIRANETLPREREFTEEERELATALPEWAAVEEHRGAMRASDEVREFMRETIHHPTPQEFDDFAPEANRQGYANQLLGLQQLVGRVNYRAPEREVELIIRARLAVRRELELDPEYFTYAERIYAMKLPGWGELRAQADRLNDQHSGEWPEDASREADARRRALWEEARQDLRRRGGAL